MTTSDDPLKDVHVSITPGCCIVCDTPIISGIFCLHCAPSPAKTPSYDEPAALMLLDEVTVENLKDGQVAYIEPLSIFTYDDRLYIIITTVATRSPRDQYRPIKISKWAGIIYVHKDTVRPSYIFRGYEGMFSDYLVARAEYIE